MELLEPTINLYGKFCDVESKVSENLVVES